MSVKIIEVCKSVAFQIKQFFNIVSKEMEINEIITLMQKLSNDISIGMNYATVYQTMATIAFMEANDGDAATIENLKQ